MPLVQLLFHAMNNSAGLYMMGIVGNSPSFIKGVEFSKFGKNLKKGDRQYRGGLHKIRGLGPLCQLWMRGVVDGKGQVTADYQQKCN